MTKQDIISYLKIFGALLMISPLVWSFFALDYGNTPKTYLFTGIIYFATMTVAIPMFNYLEHGVFSYWISHRDRDRFKRAFK